MEDGEFFNSWLKKMGRSRDAGRYWEKKGWVKTFKRYGRKFISRAEIERYERESRAATADYGFLKKAA